MKKKNLFVGMLAMALVFGMAVAGCDNGSTGDDTSNFDGSWTKGSYTVVIDGTGYTIQASGANYQKGTFS
jgi:hypothetical protein